MKNITLDRDTIFSLVTKPINQNVAILRVSGDNAFKIIREIFNLNDLKHNSITYSKLNDAKGDYIDEMLVLSFKTPNSFTGEDVIELQPHGSMFIVERIQNLLASKGARQAEKGEFTRRAFLNGKLDLIQAESINSLILSENKNLSKISSLNIRGNQSNQINTLIEEISSIISIIQVTIDYPENRDMPEYSLKSIINKLKEYFKLIDKIIVDSTLLVKYSNPIKVALIGKPNVGKSTLINSLIKEDKAIISNIKGTTRDVVEGEININGVKLKIFDTAGIRNTDDYLENLSIEKTKNIMSSADLILNLTSFEDKDNIKINQFLNELKSPIINVITKGDLLTNKQKKSTSSIVISALNNNIENLIKRIEETIPKIEVSEDGVYLTTMNQIDMFKKIRVSLKTSIDLLDNDEITIDIIFFEIESILKTLGELVGKEINKDYLFNLFSNFCLGK